MFSLWHVSQDKIDLEKAPAPPNTSVIDSGETSSTDPVIDIVACLRNPYCVCYPNVWHAIYMSFHLAATQDRKHIQAPKYDVISRVGLTNSLVQMWRRHKQARALHLKLRGHLLRGFMDLHQLTSRWQRKWMPSSKIPGGKLLVSRPQDLKRRSQACLDALHACLVARPINEPYKFWNTL